MKTYKHIVFFQGDAAKKYIEEINKIDDFRLAGDILDNLFIELKSFESDTNEITEDKPYTFFDETWSKDGYIISISHHIPYIGMVKVIESHICIRKSVDDEGMVHIKHVVNGCTYKNSNKINNIPSCIFCHKAKP